MYSYFLTIQFQPADLEGIAQNGVKVVLGKATTEGQMLPWHAFGPYQVNAVSWDVTCFLFATLQNGQGAGNVYLPLAPMPAMPGRKYIYDSEGGLHERPSDVPDAITVKNRVEPAADLEVKLLQPIWVNGEDHPSRPVMTAALPAGQDLVWKVEPVVYIWLEWGNGETTLPHRIGFSEGQTAGMVTYNGNGQWETSLRS